MKAFRSFLDRYQTSLRNIAPKRPLGTTDNPSKSSQQTTDRNANRFKDLKAPQPILSKAQFSLWKSKLQEGLLSQLKRSTGNSTSSLTKKARSYVSTYRHMLSEINPKSINGAFDKLKSQQPLVRQTLRQLIDKAKVIQPSKEIKKFDTWISMRRDKFSESIKPFIQGTVKSPLTWWQKAKPYIPKINSLSQATQDLKDSFLGTLQYSRDHVNHYFKANREWFAQWKPKLRKGGFIDRIRGKLISLRDLFSRPSASISKESSLGRFLLAPIEFAKRVIRAVTAALIRLRSLFQANKSPSQRFLNHLNNLNIAERLRRYRNRIGLKLALFCGFLVFMYALGKTLPFILLG